MSEMTTIARPYAKAAFDFAVEHKTLESWLGMLTFATEVAKNDTMQSLFQGSVAAAELGDLFVRVCGEQLDTNGQNLIRVMAENGRLSALPAVLAEFVTLKSELDKQLDAEVISATPLGETEMTRIQAALEKRYGRAVKLTCSLDPSLMAGVVIKAGDEIIDASVRSKLNRLAEALQS